MPCRRLKHQTSMIRRVRNGASASLSGTTGAADFDVFAKTCLPRRQTTRLVKGQRAVRKLRRALSEVSVLSTIKTITSLHNAEVALLPRNSFPCFLLRGTIGERLFNSSAPTRSFDSSPTVQTSYVVDFRSREPKRAVLEEEPEGTSSFRLSRLFAGIYTP